jgi:D-alanyl-D-alanine carboxypeptidase
MLKQILAGHARNAIPLYRQFELEARKDGARFIEAEHMLLAIAATPGTDAGSLLIDAGLDYQRLAAALRDEHRQSLAFAGVNPLVEGLTEATLLDRPITFGTSAKAALGRALHARHAQRSHRARLESIHLLIGILSAELGTVPRALTLADVDRAALISRARAGIGVTAPTC